MSSNSSAGGSDGPVYELRIYNVKPDQFIAVKQLIADKFQRRLAHSKPLGFWLSELGGIFQIVHIWPYESVSQRASVRQAMASDPALIEEFMNPFLKAASLMDNRLMTLCSGSSICTDFQPSKTAAYELLSLPAPEAGVNTLPLPDPGSKEQILVGRFRTVYGDINTEYRVMRYPDADTAFRHARNRLDKNDKVSGYSRLMLPADVSPIK